MLAAVFVSAVTWSSTAIAQSSASAFTTGYRWDEMRRLVGRIEPDPDGTGVLQFPAVRYTYDADGQLTKTEHGHLATWQATSVAPSSWTGFTVLETVESVFDDSGNRTRTSRKGQDVVLTLTQMSYDANDRLECTAVRMNPDAFASFPASACTLGTEGTQGKDRITKTVYTAIGQVQQSIRAFGTPDQQNYATYTYSQNGQQLTVRDANNNETRFAYDGFDRPEFTYFLDPANGSFCTPPGSPGGTPTCTGNQTYERYGYDQNGNRTSVRKRTGQSIAFTFDALNRQTFKDFVDNAGARASDVHYRYDLPGRQLHARFNSATGAGVVNIYDKAGRLRSSETSNGAVSRTLSFDPDENGNRVRLTYPDGNYIQYDYDGVNRLSAVRENGATSGAGVLATYTYDNLGRRDLLTRGNGTVSDYGFDGASRLSSLSLELPGASNDLVLGFTHNPAGQIRTRSHSNDAYKWNAPLVSRPYVPNALNQYSSVNGVSFAYDASGNLTSDGLRTMVYDAENRLRTVSGTANLTLDYDPMGRLAQSTSGSVTTQYLYDGDRLTAEFNGSSSTPLRRYAHGTGADEPLVWYEGAGVTDRRWLHADERGSIVAQSDGSGSTGYTYGPYGEPSVWSGSRFRYTGQIALPEASLYHYKARAYDPVLGRFLQTDPVGYADDFNLYAYAANDPLNATDPSGENTVVIAPVAATIVVAAGACATSAWCRSYTGETALRLLQIMLERRGVRDLFTTTGVGVPPRNVMQNENASDQSAGEEKPSLVDDERAAHILDGDETGGGHRGGTGKPGKSEFPTSWSDEKILGEVSDVATDPGSSRTPGRGKREVVRGSRDGIDIEVIVDSNGKIITAYPTNVPRNPR